MLRDKKVIALFVLPAVLIFSLFTLAPLVASLGLSFFKWDLLSPMKYIGLQNFENLLTLDDTFIKSIGNTVQYLFLSILFQIPMAYLLAVLLTQGRRFDKAFRNIIFVPVALSGTAVALMFYFIYHPDVGLLNNFIRLFAGSSYSRGWLADPNAAMVCVCVAVAWQFVGYHMVIYITGMTSISHDVLEAAQIDGANRWTTVWHIITPLMKPVLKVSLVLITTSSLKVFDSVFVLTGGGPVHATEVMASHMYTKSFFQLRYGYGSAIGFLLFVLCVACSWVISFCFREKEES
jgi:raffinose/stachyose/melibiose transport system permease protein